MLLLVVLGIVIAAAYVTQPFAGGKLVGAPAAVDPGRLRAHVEALADPKRPRTPRHLELLDRVADYVHAQFTQAGVDVTFEPYTVDGRSVRNVVARIGPETGERIVVGAHYDAADSGVGADDNASGVAGLLELAPLVKAANLPLRVELVAFTLEEPPFFRTQSMGSYVHAEGLRKAGVAVRAMIGLEMIGFFSDAPGSQDYPLGAMRLLYPSKGNFIAVVGCMGQAWLVRRVKRAMAESAVLPVRSINAPRFVPGIDFSDHLNYWNAGFPAVMVTDTAFYRNANYHEPTDTPETLDYERMALVVEGVFGAVRSLAR